jgi:hypothetical protein
LQHKLTTAACIIKLTTHFMQNHDKLKPMPVQIRENALLARIAAKVLRSPHMAIVMKRTIHLHNTCMKDFMQNRRWVRHELKHIEQFERYGTLRFVSKYLYYSMRHGYWNNPLEVEARAAEYDDSLLEKYQCTEPEHAELS